MSDMTINNSKPIRDFGGDGKVIVLLHGFLTSSKYWDKLQPLLTGRGYHVITLDLLGFGRAEKPKHSRYDYDEHIKHLDKLISRLKLNSPFVLVGHSMGALLAIRYALLYPGKVRSLVLLHPPLYKDADEVKNTLSDTSRLYRFLLDSKYNRLGWVFVRILLARQIGKHSRVSRERSMANVIKTSEALTDLAKLKTRTLLLIGLKDRPEYTYNINHSSPSSFVDVIFRDVAHHSPVKNASIIERLIIDFINTQ